MRPFPPFGLWDQRRTDLACGVKDGFGTDGELRFGECITNARHSGVLAIFAYLEVECMAAVDRAPYAEACQDAAVSSGAKIVSAYERRRSFD